MKSCLQITDVYSLVHRLAVPYIQFFAETRSKLKFIGDESLHEVLLRKRKSSITINHLVNEKSIFTHLRTLEGCKLTIRYNSQFFLLAGKKRKNVTSALS